MVNELFGTKGKKKAGLKNDSGIYRFQLKSE